VYIQTIVPIISNFMKIAENIYSTRVQTHHAVLTFFTQLLPVYETNIL
jgi:hypothetical protein